MATQRYYIRESTGYVIGKHGAGPGGDTRPKTEVLILDRAYCHRVVWTSLAQVVRYYAREVPALRDEARRLCREWNAEDRVDAA